MSRSALARRLTQLGPRIPTGCPACRTPPPLMILHDEDPEPPTRCPECGRPYQGIRVVRITRVERGPR
jgi:hypothetical protein